MIATIVARSLVQPARVFVAEIGIGSEDAEGALCRKVVSVLVSVCLEIPCASVRRSAPGEPLTCSLCYVALFQALRRERKFRIKSRLLLDYLLGASKLQAAAPAPANAVDAGGDPTNEPGHTAKA